MFFLVCDLGRSPHGNFPSRVSLRGWYDSSNCYCITRNHVLGGSGGLKKQVNNPYNPYYSNLNDHQYYVLFDPEPQSLTYLLSSPNPPSSMSLVVIGNEDVSGEKQAILTAFAPETGSPLACAYWFLVRIKE